VKLILPLVLVLVACANEDPIVRVVSDLADAAEDRDTGAVMEHLSPSYEGRAEVETTLRRYFFAYNTMDINVRDLQSTVSGEQAFVTFNADFLGTPKTMGGMDQFLPRSTTYRFELVMVEEAGEWKVTSANWATR
jgi:ketosteroid isomerase-like protein